MKSRKIALVGTGNIARTHAAVIQGLSGVEIAGVFDVDRESAVGFARQIGAGVVFESLEHAAASDVEVAHVMTPPDVHLQSAVPFLEKGKHVFLEKPVGISTSECERLRQGAKAAGAIIGVNQNFVFNPAYLKLRSTVQSGRLGKPRYLSYIYEVPLRQLTTRQFGHWMFREPLNILLEQAVHPLSQIIDLAGEVDEISTLAERSVEIAPGVGLNRACQVSMRCKQLPATLRFHVGANFTVCRMTVVCDDGVAVADMFSNQFHTLRRTAYMEPIDGWLSARTSAKAWSTAGWSGLRDYSLSMIGLRPRSDPFFLGMRGSIEAFYTDLDAGGDPRIGLTFGAHLVSVCEEIASVFPTIEPNPRSPAPNASEVSSGPLVAVIGGTGFIGTHTVAALLNASFRVRVMARGTTNLPAIFQRAGVEVLRGDVKRRADIERAVIGADFVVNLAHGGGGASFEAISAALVDTARDVAEVCASARVTRLVHVGSISGLYLGDPSATITGETPLDPLPQTRNDYARAKALADEEVFRVARETNLSVVILRPGLVIGSGTSPFHGGLGFYNNDQYCVGWNKGDNPLPWVLVDDCASATVAALTVPSADGHSYNLVGDVRPSAKDFTAALAETLQRPLRFIPSSPTRLWLTELCKWAIKRMSGRQVGRPYRRDILSRGLVAQFDCSDAKRDLAWRPESNAEEFHRKAVVVFGEAG